MRRPDRSLLTLAVTGVALGAAAAAWAASAPTGNARAISLARAEVKAYARIPAETYTQTGFMQIDDEQGQASFFFFHWGATKLSHGYTWAAERGTVALAHDRVVWWRDDLTPSACKRAGLCRQVPVEMVLEHSGAYWAFGNAAHHTCFARLGGTEPTSVGATWDLASGRYSAPAFRARSVTLVYTFPWGNRVATETDKLSARTKLVESTRTVITGGHAVRASDAYPRKAPRAPKIRLCRA